jgi:uncharacterized short protein YbdD (DUF466 family)
MRRLLALWGLLAETARLMVGQSSYAAYRAHREAQHPGEPIMDETAFYRQREQARYGRKGGGRCC